MFTIGTAHDLDGLSMREYVSLEMDIRSFVEEGDVRGLLSLVLAEQSETNDRVESLKAKFLQFAEDMTECLEDAMKPTREELKVDYGMDDAETMDVTERLADRLADSFHERAMKHGLEPKTDRARLESRRARALRRRKG